jgi:hypothetical protein
VRELQHRPDRRRLHLPAEAVQGTGGQVSNPERIDHINSDDAFIDALINGDEIPNDWIEAKT